jgi:hypothetical protein
MRFLFAENYRGYRLMIENFENYLDLLHERRFLQLKQELAELYEQDIAEFLGEVSDDDDVLKIFRLLPKNMGAELEKRLNRLNSEIRNFESLSEKAGNSLDSAGKINSSYGKIAEYARQLEITFKRIGEEAGIDASKFFPKEIITKIEGAEKAMENY